MSANYRNPNFLLPNELNQSINPQLSGLGDRHSLYSTEFDGNSFIDIQESDSIRPFSAKMSLSAWFNISGGSGDRTIFAIGIFGGGAFDYKLVVNTNNNLTFRVRTTSTFPHYVTITGGTTLNTNQWYHACVTWDGSNINLYLNGQPDATQQAASTFYYSTSYASLPGIGSQRGGSSGTSHDYKWVGKLDEIAIWNVALDNNQRQALADSKDSPVNPMALPIKPVAYYPLGEQARVGGNSNPNAGSSEWQFPNQSIQSTVIDFDGTDYIDTPSINLGTENTISFWAKRTGVDFDGVVLGGSSNSNFYTILITSVEHINYRIGGAPVPTFNNADIFSTLRSNEWFHCALVRNNSGADMLCYINGDLKQTLTGIADSSNDTIVENIGARSINDFEITGNLSNIALFNTALDASAVSTIYNNGTPASSYASTPIAWWKLNAANSSYDTATSTWTFTDSAGSNNGTSTTLPSSALVRSDLQFESPYSNFSLDFNGTNDYVDCTDNDMFSFGNGTTDSAFSLSTWINMSTVADFVPIAKDSSGAREWTIRMVSGQIHFYVIDNSVADGYLGRKNSSTPATDTWFNLICTYDGSASASGIRIYLDGVRVDDADYIGTGTYVAMENTSAIVSIGMQQNGTVSQPGKIDETAIFNKELTQAQVNQIYNNGLASDLTSLSPVSWWRLGEDAYFVNNNITIPNQIAGAPNGTGSGTQTSMLVAEAPGSYASGSGVNLDIVDRVGEAPGISPYNVGNSQSYNMIPDDRHPYVPGYTPATTNNIASMNFDGTNDYFDIGNPTELQLTGTLTFSAWFKTSTSDYQIIISKDDVTNRCFNLGLLNTGLVYGQVFNSNSSTAVETTTTWDDGIWHHVAFVYTPSTSMQVFIDGNSEKLETSNIPASIDNDPANFNIGRRTDGARYFNGDIDEVAVFNYALTAKQIREDIFNASKLVGGVKKTADLNNNSNLTAPIAWYRMGD